VSKAPIAKVPLHALEGEELLTLRQAAARVPSRVGGTVNISTVWRWVGEGVHTPRGRVRLECVQLGGLKYTSVEAIRRFLAELASRTHTTAARLASRTARQQRRASARAYRDLEAAGA
jgi:hypothetical protein